jgi:hypothetical protein
VSAQPFPQRSSWLSTLVARVEDFVFEPAEEPVALQTAPLTAHPVTAVVSAAPKSGASTIARLVAAELAARADGAALVVVSRPARRSGPPSRAAIRLATALGGAADVSACGRLGLASAAADGPEPLAGAARYLAPVVFDVAPDGSAAAVARAADRVVVVAGGAAEPALLTAVASVVGGDPVAVANRVTDGDRWDRADVVLPDSRMAARAAALGIVARGPLGAGIRELADRLEAL